MSTLQLLVAHLDKCLQTQFSSLLCIQVSPDTISITVENFRVLIASAKFFPTSLPLPSFDGFAQSRLPLSSHDWLSLFTTHTIRIQALLRFYFAFASKYHCF